MKKKILFGSIIASVLLVLLCFSSSITADVNESVIDNLAKEKTPRTPLALAFQLINKLHNHPDIQNVETEEDLLLIIDSDEELNSIYDQLSGDDCDCEDDTTPFEWPYPIICLVFGFPLILLALLAWAGGESWVGEMVGVFGYMFNCFWY